MESHLGDPFTASRPPGLGSPSSPEEDLATALDDLAAAADSAAAAKARGRALAIIEGSAAPLATGDEGFLSDKAYQGIPLLNTADTAERKVQTIAAGVRTVDVHEVRFGDHALLDTSLLRFEDMDHSFTINWHISELGSIGGQLEPAGVPTSGSASRALIAPLALPGLPMGTSTINRFHPEGAAEETRLAGQVIPVEMPAPRELDGGILDPNLKPGHETFAQIAVGDADAPAPALPPAGQVAELSAVRMIHDNLVALGATPDPGAAHTAGTANRELVASMRSRDTLPKADAAAAGSVDVQFANAEAYISDRSLRVAPGGKVSFSVTNLDGVDRTFTVRQLHNRSTVNAPGVLGWGSFDTGVVDSVTVPAAVKPDGTLDPAGTTRTLTVTPADDAFSLWVGDPNGGDQAAMAIALDRGPRQQSLELGLGPVKPLHQAFDSSGNLWVTMANADEVVMLTPTSGALSSPEPQHFPLPGGIAVNPPPAGTAAEPLLGPGDVAVDGHGIVWVTLGAANAIARIDPKHAHPGTTDGITIINLEPCTGTTCRRPPPPAAAAPLSRLPLQMRLYEDGGGNTVLFFTEQDADAIGVLRVSPGGTKLNEEHINCVCLQPLGIALDPSGDVWFSEGSSNRIGRLTLDQANPFGGRAGSIKHYNIPLAPGQLPEFVPGQPPCGNTGQPACPPLALPNPALTTLPHSVAVDRKGRVWYTGEASETVGYLDPAKAKPGTEEGFHDAPGPVNEFGRALAPADMAIDADGTVYFSDEYGDQIATATVAADGSVQAKTAFRPTARNSLTDSPLVDADGNLWFMEAGANLITRVSGVAASVPAPARSPLLIANTATGRLTGSGLREMTSVDVRLFRGGQLVSQADGVPVEGGSFETTVPLTGDDRVEIVPRGPRPPAPFSFRVASLSASIAGNGAVVGTARNDGEPLADEVTIDTGSSNADAHISSADGGFSSNLGLDPEAGGGTVSWTAGTVSARFRTVTPFSGASSVTPVGDPGPQVPGVGATPAPSSAPSKAAQAACATGSWLTRRGSGRKARRTLPLLGLSAADARRCLGKPAKRAGRPGSDRWTYRGRRALELRFTRGRVSAFRLVGSGLRSTPDRAAIGANIASFRKALGALARDGRRGYRGVVAVGTKRFADVRMTTSRSSKVSRVTVTLRPMSALDRAGRRLLRKAR